MLRKTLQILIVSAFGGVLLACLVAGGLFWRIQQEPLCSPYITKATQIVLSAMAPLHHISLESVTIAYDAGMVTLEGKNIDFETSKKEISAQLPDIVIGYRLPEIWKRKLTPNSLTIHHPTVQMRPWVTNASQTKTRANLPPSPDQALRFLRHYLLPNTTITHMELMLMEGETPEHIHINEAVLSMEPSHLAMQVPVGHIELLYRDQLSHMVLNFMPAIDDVSKAHMTLSLDQFPMHVLPPLAGLVGQKAQALSLIKNHFTLHGTIDATITSNADIELLTVHLDTSEGVLSVPSVLPKTLQLAPSHIELAFKENLRSILVNDISLHFQDKLQFKTHGEIVLRGTPEDAINLTISIANADFSRLDLYWPPEVGVEARQWVLERMPEALASAEGTVRLTRAMWENFPLPEEALAITIPLTNAKVDYLPNFPPVESIQAQAIFTGRRINIESSQATIGQSKVTNMKVMVPYLSNPENDVIIEGKVQGPAQDLLAFFPSDALKPLGVSDKKDVTAKGNATTKVYLSIPLLEDLKWQQVTYDIHSSLNNVSVKLENTIEQMKADLKFNGKEVIFRGKGNMLRQPLTFEITNQFAEDSTKPNPPTQVHFTLPVSPAMLQSFFGQAYTDLQEKFQIDGQGKLAITATIGDATHLEGKLEATDMAITAHEIGLNKQRGKESLLEFSGIREPKQIVLSQLLMKGDTLAFQGNLIWDSAAGRLQSLNLKEVKFNKNNLDLAYQYKNKKDIYRITARAIDVGSIESKPKKPTPEEGLSVSLQSDQVYFKNDTSFNQVSVSMECDAAYCYTFSMSMLSPDNKKHHAALYSSSTDRIFTAHSEDMGYVSKALGIYKNILSGTLELRLASPKKLLPPRYEGKVKATKFTVIKSPFLTKFFMLTSITGIMDLLSKGITFDGIDGTVIYSDKLLTIKEFAITGPALGVTLEGDVNFKQHKVGLNGTLIPIILGINRTLASIPLFGHLITGGNKIGVIGTNFSIKGDLKDPALHVNPLSTFAPGFLRGMFGK